jgi:hypothetical protein
VSLLIGGPSLQLLHLPKTMLVNRYFSPKGLVLRGELIYQLLSAGINILVKANFALEPILQVSYF